MQVGFIPQITNVKTESSQSNTANGGGIGFVECMAEAYDLSRITLPGKTELKNFDLQKDTSIFDDYRAKSEEETLEDHISGLLGRIKRLLKEQK
ncbi:MAG: hypothetical protein ABIJ26_03335 [Candidatus Margulisiibacteriota bacterium]